MTFLLLVVMSNPAKTKNEEKIYNYRNWDMIKQEASNFKETFLNEYINDNVETMEIVQTKHKYSIEQFNLFKNHKNKTQPFMSTYKT